VSGEVLVFIAALAGAGLFAGFIGGLFGVGGGVVIVPALYYVFGALGVDEAVRMHAAIGTALSTIISTSWRSLATHTKAGAVDFAVLKAWAPWITLGAIIGAMLAGLVDTQVLLIVFGGGLLLIALPAALGYVATGWNAEGLPPWSLGYVNLPGFVLLAGLTAATAPMGARLAHRLPQEQLKRAFALMLTLLSLNMLRGAF